MKINGHLSLPILPPMVTYNVAEFAAASSGNFDTYVMQCNFIMTRPHCRELFTKLCNIN